MQTMNEIEKLEAQWMQTAQQCIHYLSSVASISGRLKMRSLPGLEHELVLLQHQHLRTLEVLMAALWQNQAMLERIGRKLDARPSATHSCTPHQLELISVRLKAILLDLRYEDVPGLEAHAELWAELVRSAYVTKIQA